MYPHKALLDKISALPNKVNPYRAESISDTLQNQSYGDTPINSEGLRSGVYDSLGYTNQDYSSVLGKTIMRGIVNLDTFGASTIAALPSLVDNQINNGNDRIMKSISEFSNAQMSKYQPIKSSKDQSIADWLKPTWISGNPDSVWGDFIEQAGIVAGMTVGTGAILKGASLLGRGLAELDALSGLSMGNKIKNAFTTLIKPNVITGAEVLLGAEGGLAASESAQSLINANKLINGLSNTARIAGISSVQGYTEAMFEGLEGEKNFIDTEVSKYRNTYGTEPGEIALEEIKKNAKELKDARFTANMIGLSITNQPFTEAFFPKSGGTIFSNLKRFGKAVDGEGNIISKPLKWLSESPGYISRPLSILARSPIAYMEPVEELYQLAIEKGLDNYYSNKIHTKNFESGFNEILESSKVGINAMLTKEGIKSAITALGIGGISQGIADYAQNRELNQYLKTKQTVTDSEGIESKMTGAEFIKKDVEKINDTLENTFTANIGSNPVALGQTFGEKLQGFVTATNNAEDTAKLTANIQNKALEYDLSQKIKFDNIFPYIKKGYKDVIVSKIEGLYEDLKAKGQVDENTLEHYKRQALEDVDTIEKITKKIDYAFDSEFSNSSQQLVHNQLKDIAVYHAWNTEQINSQKDNITNTFGTLLFDPNNNLYKFNGENIDSLIDLEIKENTIVDGDTKYLEDKRKIYEKIKMETNSDTKKAEYFKAKTGRTDLNINTWLQLKNNQEKLTKRIDKNVKVLEALDGVRANPVKSATFLLNYYHKAETISNDKNDLNNKDDIKDTNNQLIDSLPLIDDIKNQIKATLINDKILTKKQLDELLAEVRKQQAEFEKNKNNAAHESEVKRAISTINLLDQDSFQEFIVDNDFLDSVLSDLRVQDLLEKKYKELFPEEEEDKLPIVEAMKGLTSSSMYGKILAGMNASANDIFSVKDLHKEFETEISSENTSIKVEVLPDKATGFPYDLGLIRTQLHDSHKEIFQFLQKSKDSQEPSALFTIQNNQFNFRLDLLILKRLLDDNQGNLVSENYFRKFLKANEFDKDIAFVDFLGYIHNDTIDQISKDIYFKEIQNAIFKEGLLVQIDKKIKLPPNSGLRIFRFPEVSLADIYNRLITENKLYNSIYNDYSKGISLNGDYTKEFLESNYIDITFQDGLQTLTDNINISDSEAMNDSVFQVVLDEKGNKIVNKNDVSFLRDFTEDEVNQVVEHINSTLYNIPEGYSIVFKVNDKYVTRAVTASMSYEQVRQSTPNNFRVSIINSRKVGNELRVFKDYYKVEVEGDVFKWYETSKKDNIQEGTEQEFLDFVSKKRETLTPISESLTISYLDDTSNGYEAIWNNGTVDMKLIPNSYAKIDTLDPGNSSSTPVVKTKRKSTPKKKDLNAIIEVNTSEPNVPASIIINIPINNRISITNSNNDGKGNIFTVKPGITEQDILDYLSSIKTKNISRDLNNLYNNSGFFDKASTPNFQTVSLYQEDKIKEFLKNC